MTRISKWLEEWRRWPLVVVGIVVVSALSLVAVVVAQQGDSPPLPPSMPEPPGKPQRDASPTPDLVKQPQGTLCSSNPELCRAADALAASQARGDISAFTSLLAATGIACVDRSTNERAAGRLCADAPAGELVQGYTVLGKQASAVSADEFTTLLKSWLEPSSGRSARVVSVGCAIDARNVVDCAAGAIALGLFDAKAAAPANVIVLFVRRDYGGKPLGLVGGTAALPDGAAVDGGPEPRLTAGWTGNPTGDWSFERVTSGQP